VVCPLPASLTLVLMVRYLIDKMELLSNKRLGFSFFFDAKNNGILIVYENGYELEYANALGELTCVHLAPDILSPEGILNWLVKQLPESGQATSQTAGAAAYYRAILYCKPSLPRRQ
jgi:hypothetical protein